MQILYIRVYSEQPYNTGTYQHDDPAILYKIHQDGDLYHIAKIQQKKSYLNFVILT